MLGWYLFGLLSLIVVCVRLYYEIGPLFTDRYYTHDPYCVILIFAAAVGSIITLLFFSIMEGIYMVSNIGVYVPVLDSVADSLNTGHHLRPLKSHRLP